jgi:hypothetical protein
MKEFALFMIEVAISLTISGFVIATLSIALQRLLEDLCGTETRARFWVAYTNVMLVIAPLLTVFVFGKSGVVTEASFAFFKNALGCVLLGTFVSLIVIGSQIMKSVPKKNAQPTGDSWQSQ